MGAKERAAATNSTEGYLATLGSLEPDINPIDASAFYASAAISLKRIADSLDAFLKIYSKLPGHTSGMGME